MINISYYNNTPYYLNIAEKIRESFNVTKKELNLVSERTIIISLTIHKKCVASICLISNNNLANYLKSKGMGQEAINANYLFRANRGIYIYNMSVDKNYRGKGYGQKLLEITLYVCKLMNFDYCYSHCENETSFHIFKKKGFNKENIFRNNKNDMIALMSYWLK